MLCKNENGQLGLGNYDNINTVTNNLINDISFIICSKNSTYYMKNNNDIYSVGLNTNNLLYNSLEYDNTILNTNVFAEFINIQMVESITIAKIHIGYKNVF